MAATRRITSVDDDKQTDVVESITAPYTESAERLAEAQKTLDLALLQNANLMGAWKIHRPGSAGHPRTRSGQG